MHNHPRNIVGKLGSMAVPQIVQAAFGGVGGGVIFWGEHVTGKPKECLRLNRINLSSKVIASSGPILLLGFLAKNQTRDVLGS